MYYKQYKNDTTQNHSQISNHILDIESIKDREMYNLKQKSEFLYNVKIGIDFIYNILQLFLPKIFTQDEYSVRNYIFTSYSYSQNHEIGNISIPFNHYCFKKSLSLSTISGSNEIVIMILIKMGINSGQLYDQETKTLFYIENYRVEKAFKDEIISYCMNIIITFAFQLLICILCGEVYNLFIRFYYKKILIDKGSKLGLVFNIFFLFAVFLMKVLGLIAPIANSILSIINLKIFNILVIEGMLINFVVHFLFNNLAFNPGREDFLHFCTIS